MTEDKILEALTKLEERLVTLESILKYPPVLVEFEPTPYAERKERCAYEGVKPGTPMGLVCYCSKCSFKAVSSVSGGSTLTSGDSGKFISGAISSVHKHFTDAVGTEGSKLTKEIKE